MPSVITVQASQFPNLSATETVQLAPQLDYYIYVHVSVPFYPKYQLLAKLITGDLCQLKPNEHTYVKTRSFS